MCIAMQWHIGSLKNNTPMDILENYMSNYVEDIERSIWARIVFPNNAPFRSTFSASYTCKARKEKKTVMSKINTSR